MTDNLKTIRDEISSDTRKEKIILIEDIIRSKRCAFGFGLTIHEDVIKDPSSLFDRLYDLPIEELEVLLASVCAETTIKARELAGFHRDEINIKNNDL